MTTFKLIFITGGLILFFPVVIYLLFIPVFQRVRIRWNHMFKFYHDVCFLFIVEPKGFCLLQKLALQEITVIVTGHLKMHHQWAPQNAPPCDMNNLHICRVFSRVPKYFFF